MGLRTALIDRRAIHHAEAHEARRGELVHGRAHEPELPPGAQLTLGSLMGAHFLAGHATVSRHVGVRKSATAASSQARDHW